LGFCEAVGIKAYGHERITTPIGRRGKPVKKLRLIPAEDAHGLVFDALAQLGSQTSACHQIHRNAEEIFKRQLEIHKLLEDGAGGELHQQIKVAPRPCRALGYRAEHLQTQSAMGSCDPLQRRH
jgi:excinuclease UvrABC nuclease subunit